MPQLGQMLGVEQAPPSDRPPCLSPHSLRAPTAIVMQP